MDVDTEELQRVQGNYAGSKQAVLLAFGSRMLIGVLAEGLKFTEHPDFPGRSLAAIRVSHEPVWAHQAVYIPYTNRAMPIGTGEQSTAYPETQPLSEIDDKAILII
jgi:hypothetical protein